VGRRRARLLVAMLAVLVAAVSTAAPAQAGKGAYWGTYIRARAGDSTLGELAKLESEIGRKFHAFRLYHALDNTNLRADIPAVMKARGVPLYLNVSSELGRNCVPWRDVAAGRYNSYLHHIARSIKRYRLRVFFSWNHEPLDKCSDGSPADYVASYHRVHKLFKNDGVRNITYVWTATSHNFRQDLATIRRYEPRRYDAVGVDGYNVAAWHSAAELFGAAHKFAVNHGKKLVIGEVGSVEDPNDPTAKATWITNAADTFRSWHVRLIVWTNAVTSRGDVWADTSPESLAAYRDAGLRRYYMR
jgi:hypothetical protein